MPKAGVRKKIDRSNAGSASFDEWFDREIAELNAGLARLDASLSPALGTSAKEERRPRKPVKPRPTEPAEAIPSPVAPDMAEPAVPITSEPSEPLTASEPVLASSQQPVAAPPAPPHAGTGTDLADPKNFGLMPPLADLERGTASDDDYRQPGPASRLCHESAAHVWGARCRLACVARVRENGSGTTADIGEPAD